MSSTISIPPGVNIYESRQPQLYASTITPYLLSLTAVSLRLWARRLMKTKVLLDDWLICVAFVLDTGFLISALIWIRHGYGQHFELLGKNFAANFFKNLFADIILYALLICMVKFSILAFYSRLFAASIRLPCYVLAGITTCWGIAVILVTVFQCIPVSGYWNREMPAKCNVDDYAFFVGTSVPNILTDAAILSLPVPYIWRLHRTRSQKIALLSIFALGGFVTIISIIRLTTLVSVDLKSPDLDYNFAYVGVWTSTENNIAIVSACLPSLRPVLSFLIYGDPNPSASKGYGIGRAWVGYQRSAGTQSRGDPSSATSIHHNFVTLPDETSDIRMDQYQVTAIAGKRGGNHYEDIEMQPSYGLAGSDISVRNDVNVKWARNH